MVRAKEDVTSIEQIKARCKVTEDGCWEWQGPIDQCGYGVIWSRERNNNFKVHRLVMLLHRGHLGDWGMGHGELVCHHCDNRPCCNPEHLFVGTARDNAYDMIRKGRDKHVGHPESSKGQTNGNAKLTNEQVYEIRRRADAGPRGIKQQLAKEFGVTPAMIGHIACRRSWTHLPEEDQT